jgi:hypothetical protein
MMDQAALRMIISPLARRRRSNRGSDESPQVEALKLAYEDAKHENARLRDARASFTRQLGPLPISAAVIAGLVAAFPGKSSGSPAQLALISFALLLFAVMVLVSTRYSGMKPYRALREEFEVDPPEQEHINRSEDSPEALIDRLVNEYAVGNTELQSRSASAVWYARMIKLERSIRGEGKDQKPTWKQWRRKKISLRKYLGSRVKLLWPDRATSSQEGLDLERQGLFVVQGLFAAVVVTLIVARTI